MRAWFTIWSCFTVRPIDGRRCRSTAAHAIPPKDRTRLRSARRCSLPGPWGPPHLNTPRYFVYGIKYGSLNKYDSVFKCLIMVQEAGLPVGGEEFNQYAMLEVHYNNPERRNGNSKLN
jgi:hypothetical protein